MKWISNDVHCSDVQNYLRKHVFDESTLSIVFIGNYMVQITFRGREKELV